MAMWISNQNEPMAMTTDGVNGKDCEGVIAVDSHAFIEIRRQIPTASCCCNQQARSGLESYSIEQTDLLC